MPGTPPAPGPAARRRPRGPAPELGYGPPAGCQRRADITAAAAAAADERAVRRAVQEARVDTPWPSPRPGLPESAAGPGRREAAEAGLYAAGRSNPALRPAIPEGEPDAAAVLDLPPGGWIGDPPRGHR